MFRPNLAAFAILIVVASVALADSPTDALPAKSVPTKTEPAKPEPPKNDPAPKDPDAPRPGEQRLKIDPSTGPLDQQLLRRLVGGDESRAKDDPLERAIQRMRSVEGRIGQRDSGEETRALQRQIVGDLDKLIELAKQAQQQPQKNPSNPSDPQQQQQPQSQAVKTENRPQNGQGTESRPESAAGTEQRRTESKAAQSTESQAESESPEDERQQRDRIVKDVWGHLPPALRQQLLNVYSEKYLPKYDDLVRRYFEALAEQGQRR